MANTPDRGTSSAPTGALFGSNVVAALGGGATNVLDVNGTEIDVGMYSGSSSAYRTDLRIASYGAAKANVIDAALQAAVLADTGFNYRIAFTNTQPVDHDVPHVEKATVTEKVQRQKLDPATGESEYVYGVRYEGLTLAMLAEMRRHLSTADLKPKI